MKRTKLIAAFVAVTALTVAAGCERKTVVTDVNAMLKGMPETTVMVSSDIDTEVVADNTVVDNEAKLNPEENIKPEEKQTDISENEAKDDSKKNSETSETDVSDEKAVDDEQNDDDKDAGSNVSEEDDGNTSEDDANEENLTVGNDAEEDETETTQEEELVIPPDFDPAFYAEHNPDVVEMFGDSPEALYKHYRDYGQSEGRLPSASAAGQEEQN